jgi:SNF2 family DNA or RNA helicase
VEEKILALQKNKIKLAQDLITIDDGFVKALSKDDIENLLQ